MNPDFRNVPMSRSSEGNYMKKAVEMRIFREYFRNN